MIEEKSLTVVILEVAKSVAYEDVKESLSKKRTISSRYRMRHGSERKPMPLVLVQLRKTAKTKAIFQFHELLLLKVTIESPSRKTGVERQVVGNHHNGECQKTLPSVRPIIRVVLGIAELKKLRRPRGLRQEMSLIRKLCAVRSHLSKRIS